MKAILFDKYGDPSVMYIGEAPKPIIDENEVLIKVAAAGVNRPDILQRQGGYPPPKGASEILGLEVSGKIVEIGKNINSSWKIGDPAVSLPFISCGKCKPCINGNPFFCEINTTSTGMSPEVQGGYAEFVRIGLPESVKIPKGVSWDFGVVGILASDLWGPPSRALSGPH